MNVLLVYPKYPDTYWSFKYALKFISKKAAIIPLGLVTVSSLLPENWCKNLIDLNVSNLNDRDILWADLVFISAMAVQRKSVDEILLRCKNLQKVTVAGGPLFTEEYEHFTGVDHLILNEAELTLPLFIEDLKNGIAKKIYKSDKFAEITSTPIPDYSLLKLNKYASVAIQYSRGCPFDCEFCDIIALFGHKVRTKTADQLISELDKLLKLGWKGSVFFVDDNFIGNKNKLKTDVLPKLIQWMKSNRNPFTFCTEASINLADDQELMNMMVQAGFDKVFIGIETPDEQCLMECNKIQNNNRDLISCVNAIQQNGMEVAAGFIVGFDHDLPTIFQRQIDFIQRSGIISAMVGLLNAPKLSKLYQRLNKEGRILDNFSGDNTDYNLNFIPVMDKEQLLTGYQKIIHDIYSSKSYYTRVKLFLKQYTPPYRSQRIPTFQEVMALFKSVVILGIITKNRQYYWKLVFWSLINKPKSFLLAITYSIYGYHFRKVFRELT